MPDALVTPATPPAAPPAPVAPALRLAGVSKTFRLPHQRYSTLKERVLHPLRTRTYDDLRAVRDISVDVAPGEFFGVVGRNGSGKSTLLKCVAGIYAVDAGRVEVNGHLSPFIELGVGFNAELTARENVIINAIMLGLTRREARARFDDIIAFAELEEFLDLKLKNYSSGMNVRLAFAVAIHVDADILLVDEVLAVGDAAFQQKCFDQFRRLKAERRTIVLVTHDMTAVERFCDRAMLMERGELVQIGEPRAIARAYNELNFGGLVHGPGARPARTGAEIVDCWFEDARGARVTTLAQGEPFAICAEVRFHDAVEAPVFALTLRNAPRHTVFATSTRAPGSFGADERALVRVALENWFAPSRYDATPSVAAGDAVLDVREDLATLAVEGARFTGGILDLPHEITVERA